MKNSMLINVIVVGIVCCSAALCSANLVAYYDFETVPDPNVPEPNVPDVSGYGTPANGTVVGNPQWVTGKVGNYAMEFDGNATVNCGQDAKFNFTGEITISAWIKADAGTANPWQMFISKGNVSGWRICRFSENPSLFFGVGNVLVYGQTPIFDNAWHHVAGTYDGSVAILYIDGGIDRGSGGSSEPIPFNS